VTVPVPDGACGLSIGGLQASGTPPGALLQNCLQRIDAREPHVRAWAYLNPAQIRASAQARDHTMSPGTLAGIPVGVKDIMLTRDMPTGYNSDLPRPGAIGADAAAVAILRHAGALIFGKTDTVEFAAIGRRALTRNPHDLSRTPGASSSGSAAAVADFHVPLALGTQTGGSIIRPASFCGVYGFKPSWGLVCMDGVKPFAPSLDTLGWFTRTATDAALVLDLFEPPAASIKTPARIGLCRTPMWGNTMPATRAAIDHAVRRFQAAGATVSDLELPSAFAQLPAAHALIMRAEGGRSFQAESMMFGDRLHIGLRRMVSDVQGLDMSALLTAYNLAAACRAEFDAVAGQFDAILTPSTVGEAPYSICGTGDYLFNGLWTLLHVPCLNIPGYNTAQRLPVGVTLTGPRGGDRRVIGIAAWLEAQSV
jgi:Asp-tRNA(Asn)/Glu-tRNA(Gln) amidotransferase A subunit family amidase